MGDLPADVAEKTRELVGALIKKPKLSDKLLNKPPFRFLHDVVTNIGKATGFGVGLYEGDELNAKGIKGKGPKTAYLNKIIACVGIAQGKAVKIIPAKVVAGKNATDTNKFLQALATVAADDNIDKAACVEMALNGAEPGSSPPPTVGGGGGGKEADPDEGKAAPAPAPEPEPEVKVPEPAPAPAPAPKKKSSGGGGGGGGVDLSAVTGEIADTVAALKAIIKKPKLSDKLMNKPPFRFLHDVIMNVIKATGYRDDLYVGDERNSKAVKGKENKIAFLQKMMDAVSEDLGGVKIDCKPNKVVAGRDADKTRKFLHMITLAATGGGGGGGGDEAKAEPEPARARGRRKREPEPDPDEEKEERGGPVMAMHTDEPEPSGGGGGGGGGGAEEKNFEVEAPRPSTRLARPTTARRRPPTIRENTKKVDLTPMSKNVQSAGVMLEGEKDEDSDEDEGPAFSTSESKLAGGDGKHSKLVQDILDSEKKDKAAKSKKGGKEKDGKGGIRMSRISKAGKTNNAAQVDVALLKRSIQHMCQSTNPLGKCMDYVHEDVETMKSELEKWKSTYSKSASNLEEEERVTEQRLRELKRELADKDTEIEERRKKCNTIKASIAKNDIRINELLRMVVSAPNNR